MKKGQRAIDYKMTFTTEPGMRVLDDLKINFSNRSCFAAGDPYQTAFLNGERQVVLYIEQRLKEKPEKEMEEDAG